MQPLLRETIAALVAEAINRPGAPGQKKPERFELNAFKALPRLVDMIEYADARLECLGFGTARTVFRLTGTRVLKLANNQTKGVAQNKAEVDVANDATTAGVVTRIFEHDPKYRWVISEVVRPMNDEDDFQQLTGIPWVEFADHIKPQGPTMSYWEPEGEYKQFIDAARRVLNAKHLEWADVAVVKHWGKSPDGRAVLLDYGYTEEVASNFYSGDTRAKAHAAKVDWNEPPAGDEVEIGPNSRLHRLPPKMADLSKRLR
jgi:hypothetical protein